MTVREGSTRDTCRRPGFVSVVSVGLGFAAGPQSGVALDFDDVVALRSQSAAWRLLRADNAPLILAFLGRVFVDENVRSISALELASRLDDELFALNQRLGEGTYPKAAKAYLDDWASPEAGWLRKYYPPGSDEPYFDATPAVERALSWVKSLQVRTFVGTESRLNTIFALLQEMAFGAETDLSFPRRVDGPDAGHGPRLIRWRLS